MKWLLGGVTALSLSVGQTGVAKTCDVALEGNDQMKFNLTEVKVGADCSDVKLTLKHVGKLPKSAMGHNFLLTKTADKDAVLADAIKAGVEKDYIAPGPKILAHTKLVGGGESDTVTFSIKGFEKGPGKYLFFCSFPGHSALMTGTFMVEGGAGATAKALKKK